MLKVLPHLQSRKDAERALAHAIAQSRISCPKHPVVDTLCEHCSRLLESAAGKVAKALFADARQSLLFDESPRALSSNCKRFIKVLRRFERPGGWDCEEERDADWFADEIESSARFKSLDLEGILMQWEAWLETELTLKQSRHLNRFPRIPKRSLINFLLRTQESLKNGYGNGNGHTNGNGSNGNGNGHGHAKVPFALQKQMTEIRGEARKTALGRSESPEQFEQRVKRMCERSNIPYVGS